MANEEANLPVNAYESLLEECRAALTEARFAVNWTLIETKHALGKLIGETVSETAVTQTIMDLSSDLKTSARTLWDCYRFYKKFPDLSQLPEGKNISFRKIRINYLGASPTEPDECPHDEIELISVCAKCRKKLSEDEVTAGNQAMEQKRLEGGHDQTEEEEV